MSTHAPSLASPSAFFSQCILTLPLRVELDMLSLLPPTSPRMHFSTPWHFRLTIFTLSSCTLPSQCRAHFFPPQQAKTTVGKSVLVLRNAARAACIEQQMWRGHGQMMQSLQTQHGGHLACCTSVRTHSSVMSISLCFLLLCDWVLCSDLREASAASP